MTAPLRGTWVPKDQRTPTWEIWNTRFPCRVPKIDMISVEEIKTFGMFSTYNNKQDLDMSKEPITVQLTINEMVEHFRKGTSVKLIRSTDSVKIYDLITKHLKMWEEYLKWSGTLRNAPYEDLLEMDDFASTVHSHAKFEINKNTNAKSLFEKQLFTLTAFTRQQLPPNTNRSAYTEEDIERLFPKREGMSAVFKSYKLEGQ